MLNLDFDALYDVKIIGPHQIIDPVHRTGSAVLHRKHAVSAQTLIDGRENPFKILCIDDFRHLEEPLAGVL